MTTFLELIVVKSIFLKCNEHNLIDNVKNQTRGFLLANRKLCRQTTTLTLSFYSLTIKRYMILKTWSSTRNLKDFILCDYLKTNTTFFVDKSLLLRLVCFITPEKTDCSPQAYLNHLKCFYERVKWF